MISRVMGKNIPLQQPSVRLNLGMIKKIILAAALLVILSSQVVLIHSVWKRARIAEMKRLENGLALLIHKRQVDFVAKGLASENPATAYDYTTNFIDLKVAVPKFHQFTQENLPTNGVLMPSSYNICIGEYAGMNLTTNSGCILLGRHAEATADRQLVIRFLDGTEWRMDLPTNTIVDMTGMYRQ
jgi:hypothetical protein